MNLMNVKTMTLWDVTDENGLLTDGDWVESKDQDPNGNISLIQLADIKDGYFQRKSDRYLNERTAKRLNCTFLEEGDVLVARLPDPLGRACIYPGEERKAVTAVDVCVVRIDKEKFSNRWLVHLINNPHFRKEINKFQSGTTRKRISKKNLAAISFTVPEKKTQDKIADYIETQFTRLDAAIKSLKAIKAKLELYRNSVLKASFDKDWQYNKLGNLFDTMSGGTPSRSNKKYYTGTISWIKSGELNDNMNIEHSEEHITSEAVDNSSAKIFPPDTVMIALYGATTGKLGILRKESTTNQAICGILPQKGYLPEFVFYFLLFKRASLISQGKGGAQPNISQEIVRDTDFPKANEKMQREVIDSIESQLSVIDKVGGVVDASLAKAEKLRKSILKSAFEGKLVN